MRRRVLHDRAERASMMYGRYHHNVVCAKSNANRATLVWSSYSHRMQHRAVPHHTTHAARAPQRVCTYALPYREGYIRTYVRMAAAQHTRVIA